jgi:hypothetical protein
MSRPEAHCELRVGQFPISAFIKHVDYFRVVRIPSEIGGEHPQGQVEVEEEALAKARIAAW